MANASETAGLEQALKEKRESMKIDGNQDGIISTEMWTDLYAPRLISDLVGNRGIINDLEVWLRDWDDVHIRGNKK